MSLAINKKDMKKNTLCLTALLAVSSLAVSAQSEGSFRFGVTGGMNVANLTNTEADSRIGFNVGLRGEYSITNNVYIGGAFLFSQKGSKDEETAEFSGVSAKAKYTNNPGYLQIPVQVGYRFDLGNGVYVFGETGPYFAFGVCGKSKVEVEGNVAGFSGSKESKADFFGDDGANTFDGGWGVRAGVEASGFQVHLGYEYGFSKLFATVDGQSGVHNSNFTIGVSYFF